MRPRPVLRKFLALDRTGQSLVLEAVFWLAAMRLAVRMVRMKRVLGWLALSTGETVVRLAPAEAERIAGTVLRVSAHVPWRSLCLDQAMAAAAMLQRRRLPVTLYLGARRSPQEHSDLQAHAWLRCGDRILTGEGESRRFPAVASFRSPGSMEENHS
jgi:hypothetical protein